MKDKRSVINVGTIGHVDHGRATLSAVLLRRLEQEGVEVVPVELDQPLTIPIHCYDHDVGNAVIIEAGNTPRGPRIKRGKGNRYR